MRTAVIDIGTTSVRCAVYDEFKMLDIISKPLTKHYPQKGFVELDPMEIFLKGKQLLDEMIEKYDVEGISITNQRTTSVLWDVRTSENIFPALTWQDIRAKPIAESLNKLWIVKLGKILGKFATSLYHLIPTLRNKRRVKYLVTISKLSFKPNHASVHLMWMLQNLSKKHRERISNLRFGTIDSWFLYKLTGEHYTDYTNASATGIYDIFFDKWSENILRIIQFSEENLPEIKNSDYTFGEYKGLPIAGIVADQQASLISLACFDEGFVKCTNGTGTFVDLIVGDEPSASLSGLIPMCAIRTRRLRRYLLEGYISFSGSSIEWLRNIGVFDSPEETSRMAERSDDDNILMIPAFAGLGTPHYTESPAVLWGVSNKTSREDIVKALLESIAFRIGEIVKIMKKEAKINKEIRADGKMSSNDFLLQRIADTSGLNVVRGKYLEGSSFGAHLIAGISLGKWRERDIKFLKSEEFAPKNDMQKKFQRWQRLLRETKKRGWY
jgi:glycerol kinase